MTIKDIMKIPIIHGGTSVKRDNQETIRTPLMSIEITKFKPMFVAVQPNSASWYHETFGEGNRISLPGLAHMYGRGVLILKLHDETILDISVEGPENRTLLENHPEWRHQKVRVIVEKKGPYFVLESISLINTG